MFNDLNSQGNQAVDDIFAETDKGGASAAPSIETQPAGLSAQSYGQPDDQKGGGSKVKLILIIVLSVLILGAAAYLVYSKFLRPSEELPLVNEPQTPAQQKADTVTPSDEEDVVAPEVVAPEMPSESTTTAPIVDTTTSTPETPVVSAPVDSDGDSLLDSEEDALGTNSSLIDSDFDGLSDYEETKVYGTNPANPDTDSDTFKDGDEVKNGYNPKGEGKL